MKFLQVRLTLTLTLTLTRVKAQALTLILPGGAAAEPQAGWARHSVNGLRRLCECEVTCARQARTKRSWSPTDDVK